MARSAAHLGTTRVNAGEAPIVVPVSGTALLLIDVFNDLAFDGSEALVAKRNRWPLRSRGSRRRATLSNTAADNDYALRQIKTVLKGNLATSTRLRFQSNHRSRTAKHR